MHRLHLQGPNAGCIDRLSAADVLVREDEEEEDEEDEDEDEEDDDGDDNNDDGYSE
jgi:hypothetical protein